MIERSNDRVIQWWNDRIIILWNDWIIEWLNDRMNEWFNNRILNDMWSYYHKVEPSVNDDIIPVDQPASLVGCKWSNHGISHCHRKYCSEQPSSVICVQSNSGSPIENVADCHDARVMTIIMWEFAIVYPTRRTSKKELRESGERINQLLRYPK